MSIAVGLGNSYRCQFPRRALKRVPGFDPMTSLPSCAALPDPGTLGR